MWPRGSEQRCHGSRNTAAAAIVVVAVYSPTLSCGEIFLTSQSVSARLSRMVLRRKGVAAIVGKWLVR